MDRRQFLAGTGGAFGMTALHPAFGQSSAPEKKVVKLGVATKSYLGFLPLSVASSDFFAAEGLEVEVVDLVSGPRTVTAVMSGNVDVVVIAYEHVFLSHANNKPLTALCMVNRYPAIQLQVGKESKLAGLGAAGLKGKKIGITQPGSQTYYMALKVLKSAGLGADDVSFVALGTPQNVIAGIENGKVDAVCIGDPVAAELERRGVVVTLFESRSQKGALQMLGGDFVSGVFAAPPKFAQDNPATAQRMVNAFVRSLDWIHKASGQEAVTKSDWNRDDGSRATFIDAYGRIQDLFDHRGTIDPVSAQNTYGFAQGSYPQLREPGVKVEVGGTYSNRLVSIAQKSLKA